MAENPNLAIQQRFVTAVFAGDVATLTELCAPDFVLEQAASMPYAGSYHGAEGFLKFLGIFGETLEIEKLETTRIYQADDPDWLVCEFDLRGVVKATGQTYETTMLERWQFRGGRVVRVKPHYFVPPMRG